MKELSTEEKARAYDEAINRMKHYVVDEYGCSRIKVADVFPELKESEDERIRKTLIKYFRTCVSLEGINGEDISNWLEKQGEQKPVEWHREDEQNLNACLGYIPDEFLRRWLQDIIHTKYDKAVWSEDDEKYMNIVVSALCNPSTEGLYCFHKVKSNDVTNWFKSLKDRVQPQNQWKPSEEQLKSLQEVIDAGHYTSYPYALETLYEQIKKLKKE